MRTRCRRTMPESSPAPLPPGAGRFGSGGPDGDEVRGLLEGLAVTVGC